MINGTGEINVLVASIVNADADDLRSAFTGVTDQGVAAAAGPKDSGAARC